MGELTHGSESQMLFLGNSPKELVCTIPTQSRRRFVYHSESESQRPSSVKALTPRSMLGQRLLLHPMHRVRPPQASLRRNECGVGPFVK